MCVVVVTIVLTAVGAARAQKQQQDQMSAGTGTLVDSGAAAASAAPNVEATLHLLTTQLKLSDAQQNAVRADLQDAARQRQSLAGRSDLDPEQRSARKAEIRDTMNAKIDAQLTGQQKDAFEELRVQKAQMSRMSTKDDLLTK